MNASLASNNARQHHIEMGISLAEFYRLLPLAVQQADYTVKDNHIKLKIAKGSLSIHLKVGPPRKIGALVLPVLYVNLYFTDIPATKVAQWLHHFKSSYQRGGG